jgi:hypothetical protein
VPHDPDMGCHVAPMDWFVGWKHLLEFMRFESSTSLGAKLSCRSGYQPTYQVFLNPYRLHFYLGLNDVLNGGNLGLGCRPQPPGEYLTICPASCHLVACDSNFIIAHGLTQAPHDPVLTTYAWRLRVKPRLVELAR